MEKNRAASEKDIRNEQKTEIGFMLTFVGSRQPFVKIGKNQIFPAFFPWGKILRNELLFGRNHGRMETIKIKQHNQT